MKMQILNLDAEFEKDVKSGVGFPIDEPVPITKKELIRNPRGIYSNLFGGDISDITEIQRRYTCECGETIGKFRAGTKCPHCGTIVKFQDDEIERTGWMSLKEPYCLINPKMYKFLESILKTKRLDEMIRFDRKLDKHGMLDMESSKDSKNPYANIGILEFRNRLDEIIQNMGDKKKTMEIKFVLDNRDKIFTSHIPVMSLLLRPVVLISGTTFNYDPINKYYSEMVSHVAYINNNCDDELTYANISVLYELQKKFNELEDEITKQKINGKKHAIRSFILGSRINFSARHVLIPNSHSVQMDGLVIPYQTFVEFYKFHIMNIYKKLYNVTINELQDRWYTLVANHDPSILNIIQILIRKTEGGMRVYTNRNPTIAWGSTMCLKIIGINEDPDDLTMSIDLNVCPPMNADFDGDTLNNVPIIEQSFADKFEKFFSPERMTISVATGKFNRKVSLIKDQLVGLYSFCNDDTDDADTEFDPDDNFSIVTPQMIQARDAMCGQIA